MKEMLGAYLVRRGLLSDSQLQTALGHQKRVGGRLGTNLVELRMLPRHLLLEALAEYYDRPWIDLDGFIVRADLIQMIPTALAREAGVVPVKEDRDRQGKKLLFCAMLQPDDLASVDKLMFVVDHVVKPMVAFDPHIRELIDYHYHDPMDTSFASYNGRDAVKIAEDTSPDSLDHLFSGSDQSNSNEDYRPAEYWMEDGQFEFSLDASVEPRHYITFLINLLLKKGVLTEEDVKDILRKNL